MHVERHVPSPQLGPLVLGSIEGWEQTNGTQAQLREVPFPGVPLVFGLETAWQLDGPLAVERTESFVAGMHAAPALALPTAPSWSCIELRLTPVAAHGIFGLPMHELTNRTVALGDVAPEADELVERMREAAWPERFELVEGFLLRRLGEAPPQTHEVEWSWHVLRRTGGRMPIGRLADELGWSHRRLIARFRDEVGLGPKVTARVFRFDRAVQEVRAARPLGEIAYDCGYADQAHLNREFRALAGTTPTDFRAAAFGNGAVAA